MEPQRHRIGHFLPKPRIPSRFVLPTSHFSPKHYSSLTISSPIRSLESGKNTISIQIADHIKGRGIFAKQQIGTDETVFYEPPLAAVPSTLEDFCDLCLTPISDDTLILPSGERIFASWQVIQKLRDHPAVSSAEEVAHFCENCDLVKYCSKKCQILSEEDHPRVCGLLDRDAVSEKSSVPDPNMIVANAFLKNPLHHLMVKLYAKISSEVEDNKEIQFSKSWCLIKELDHDYTLETNDDQHQEELEVIAYLLPHIPQDCSLFFLHGSKDSFFTFSYLFSRFLIYFHVF